MTSSRSDLARDLREHLHERHGTPDWHPVPQELVDYHESRLPPASDEKIRDHLVDCADCSALLLELADLKDKSGTTDGGVTDFATAAAWRRLRARLAAGGRTAPPAPSPWAWRTAAVLAVATLGLGLWAAGLYRTVEELRAPQLELPIVNLEPVGSTRATEAAASLALAPGGARWVLILNLIDDTDYPSYHLELVGSDGSVRSTLEGLSKSSKGDFRLSLPRDFLAPGEYRAILSGVRGGDAEPIAEYALRIEER